MSSSLTPQEESLLSEALRRGLIARRNYIKGCDFPPTVPNKTIHKLVRYHAARMVMTAGASGANPSRNNEKRDVQQQQQQLCLTGRSGGGDASTTTSKLTDEQQQQQSLDIERLQRFYVSSVLMTDASLFNLMVSGELQGWEKTLKATHNNTTLMPSLGLGGGESLELEEPSRKRRRMET